MNFLKTLDTKTLNYFTGPRGKFHLGVFETIGLNMTVCRIFHLAHLWPVGIIKVGHGRLSTHILLATLPLGYY